LSVAANLPRAWHLQRVDLEMELVGPDLPLARLFRRAIHSRLAVGLGHHPPRLIQHGQADAAIAREGYLGRPQQINLRLPCTYGHSTKSTGCVMRQTVP
jgi:hypothetical protein